MWKNLSESAGCELLRPATMTSHSKANCHFLPLSDAQFETQRVILIMSASLNAVRCCRMIGLLDIYVNNLGL